MDCSSAKVGSSDRKRLTALSFVLSLLFSLLVLRFYQVQILEGEKWTRLALAQHQYVVKEPGRRGAFYSNTSIKQGHPDDEQPFVVDVLKFHLYVDSQSIPQELKEKTARGLEKLLGDLKIRPSQDLFREISRQSRSRKIAVWLNREQRKQIEEWWGGFSKQHKLVRNALFFLSDFQRSYPFGALLGSVLHTVQEQKDPQTGEALPTGGLEMLLDSYLRGKEGRKLFLRSARHPLDSGKILEPPENGADIYLTVNHYLQAILEAELEKGIRAVNAKGGWAVMMDPYTGEILALGQKPSFIPAEYARFYNDPEQIHATQVKAVTECFEPGSIFKPITMALCMRANEELIAQGKAPLFSPEEKVATDNGWFPGRHRPLKDGRVHRFLNMDMAIQKSSNVYMGKMAHRLVQRMGEQWYQKMLIELFGFGTKTGIDLPAESLGLVPSPHKFHPNGRPQWSTPTPYSLAMGHNILVNSIQMVRAYAILANGGYAVQPHLVRRIMKTLPTGEKKILWEGAQKNPLLQVLDRSIAERVVRSMKFVTKEGGSSKRADIPGYTEVGKSGTAEKIIEGKYAKNHHVSSFLGFAPAQHPRFVLLVSLDDPEPKFVPGVGRQQFGGICAAPVFREIALRSLEYLGIAPDDPHGYPIGDPRRNLQKAEWMEEVRSLKQTYEQWNAR